MTTPQAPSAAMKVMERLENLTPIQMVEDEAISKKFIQLYNNVHGSKSGELFYQAEKFYFMKQLNEVPALKQCSKLSLYGCFMDVAVNGLSFDPTKKHVYIIPRNFNAGTKDAPKWEKRAALMISPYGELTLRMQTGQIKYADNPVIVYEGDQFSVKDENGQKSVSYSMKIPRTPGAKIVASFIKIVRADGSVDYSYLLPDDIARLASYSSKQNNGTANALYNSVNGGIDPGFLAAKTIKHAFKSYPKVRKGDFSELEEPGEVEKPINYDIEPETTANSAAPVNQDAFTPEVVEEPKKTTVTVTDDSDTF